MLEHYVGFLRTSAGVVTSVLAFATRFRVGRRDTSRVASDEPTPRFVCLGTLDRHLPDFDVNEVHEIGLDIPAERALDRMLELSVTPDWIVKTLFRIRGLGGLDLSIEQFVEEELGLELVERTSTRAVAAGRLRRERVAILFEATEVGDHGSRLVTETRVADVDLAFRAYWLVVRPFSGLVRRRWLAALRKEE